MKTTKDLNPHIFRGYDIRGVYPSDINKEVAYTVGKTFGTHIKKLESTKCIIGHDNRLSSEELSEALIQGILDTGVDVISLGLVTTPMYYYACIKLDVAQGIMVTASHNPKDENGFKMAFDKSGNAKGQMIQDFYQEAIKGDFEDGTGNLSHYNIKEDYFELMHHSLDFGSNRRKVVIDCGNGTTSIIARELYEQFPIDLIAIYDESDGSFPNHHPDPGVEANLEGLKRKVKETHADVGIAFDGDGDRVGVIDENGTYISADLYMIMIIRDLMDQVENKTFLYDIKCTKALEDEIKKLGGTPYCYRVGNSYTKAKVAELDLPFGGELSGHVYFRDRFPGFDSGLYAGLRLLEILSKTSKATSELLEGIEKYYSTEELKFKSTDEKKQKVVDQIQAYCEEKGYQILTIDGVKVQFEDGWAVVRVSNTGPNITARFEAKTEERLNALQEEFTTLIEKYNQSEETNE